MVCAKIHIICGNCGHNHEYDNFTFEYKEVELAGKEIINPATVYIRCSNCSTLHSLSDYMQEYKR